MQISTLFSQDAKLLDALVALLTREQTLLVDMDIDAIEDILDKKGVLLQQITQSTQNRHTALGKEGFQANENGMAMWVRANQQHQAAWQAFQTQLEKAKELNRVNGQVINQHFKRNQQAINQLQGNQQNANAGVYGPNGQTTTPSHTRGVLTV